MSVHLLFNILTLTFLLRECIVCTSLPSSETSVTHTLKRFENVPKNEDEHHLLSDCLFEKMV